MIRVQHKEQVDRLRGYRIDDVFLGRHREEHVQHVCAVVEVVPRIDEGLPEHVLVRGGRDGRDLGENSVRENLAVTRIIDVHGVVIERRHGGHDRGHHRHRMRVVVKAIEEA